MDSALPIHFIASNSVPLWEALFKKTIPSFIPEVCASTSLPCSVIRWLVADHSVLYVAVIFSLPSFPCYLIMISWLLSSSFINVFEIAPLGSEVLCNILLTVCLWFCSLNRPNYKTCLCGASVSWHSIHLETEIEQWTAVQRAAEVTIR